LRFRTNEANGHKIASDVSDFVVGCCHVSSKHL
jgi:hypothetical protein